MVRQRVPEVEINRTMQALYDLIVRAIREQGRPSMSPAGQSCMYLGTDGAKCAVGHLISPSAYRENMEGKHVADDGVWKAVTKHPLVKAAIKANDEDTVEEFLWLMQQAHDQAAYEERGGVPFMVGFLDRSRGVGKELKLDTKEAA